MKKIILSTASLILLFACNTTENKTAENLQDSIVVLDTSPQEETQSINVNKSLSEFISKINLNETTDTFYFEEQFEDPIINKFIAVSNDILSKCKIEFSYETSLAVNNAQDKSCVLYNGKHSYLPWQTLVIYENYTFQIPAMEQNIIPINDYHYNNIINDLKNNCNEPSFMDAVKDSAKIKETSKPIISTYYLKFTNKFTTKIVVIKAQYGC